MVSAPLIAKERGIQIATTNQAQSGIFEGYIKVTVTTEKRERSIAVMQQLVANAGGEARRGP